MARQRIVAARRVDDDEIGPIRTLSYEGLELAFVHSLYDMTFDGRQFDAPPRHRVGTVLEIAAHGALAVVEVESDHAGAAKRQSDSHMDGGRRLTRTALFIGENNTVGGGRHRARIPVKRVSSPSPIQPAAGPQRTEAGRPRNNRDLALLYKPSA